MKIKVALKKSQRAKEYDLKRFEELFQIQYMPHLEMANWRVESWMKKKCEWAHKKGKIGQLGIWLGKLHGKQIEEAAIPDVTIRWMHEKIGYGLFTNRPLKKWEFIGEYTGTLRRRNFFSPKINDYCFMYPKEWISLKAFTIDSEKQGNFTRFINHSDSPNCESVSVYHEGIFHIIFRAIQDIPENSELTYDYGDIYWRKRKKFKEEKIEDLICPEGLKKIQNNQI